MNIRYPIYEGVYRILTNFPPYAYNFSCFFFFLFFFLKKESSGISSAGADKPENRPPKPVIKELSVLSGADTDF